MRRPRPARAAGRQSARQRDPPQRAPAASSRSGPGPRATTSSCVVRQRRRADRPRARRRADRALPAPGPVGARLRAGALDRPLGRRGSRRRRDAHRAGGRGSRGPRHAAPAQRPQADPAAGRRRRASTAERAVISRSSESSYEKLTGRIVRCLPCRVGAAETEAIGGSDRWHPRAVSRPTPRPGAVRLRRMCASSPAVEIPPRYSGYRRRLGPRLPLGHARRTSGRPFQASPALSSASAAGAGPASTRAGAGVGARRQPDDRGAGRQRGDRVAERQPAPHGAHGDRRRHGQAPVGPRGQRASPRPPGAAISPSSSSAPTAWVLSAVTTASAARKPRPEQRGPGRRAASPARGRACSAAAGARRRARPRSPRRR